LPSIDVAENVIDAAEIFITITPIWSAVAEFFSTARPAEPRHCTYFQHRRTSELDRC
jgi:hypothetical protein